MTFKQLGQKIKQSPRFRKVNGKKLDLYPDEFIALRALEKQPRYWDLVSPGARWLRECVFWSIVNTRSDSR